MRNLVFCVAVLLVVLLAFPVQAATTQPVVFAGVQDHQVSIFTFDPGSGTLEAERLPAHPSGAEYDNLSWSPGGLILSFTQTIDPRLELEPRREELIFSPTLPEHRPFVVETSLSRYLETFYAPLFDANSYLTYVVRPPEDVIYQDNDFHGVTLDVYQRTQYPGQPPQRIGHIVYGYGCGLTPNSAMEALQYAEGAVKSLIMATPHGILFSPFCAGRGLALSTEGQFTLLHDDLTLIAVAPDQASLAGWDGTSNSVAWYDLATRTTTECPVEGEVTQIAWAEDGASFYYSTRYQSGEFAFTPEETAALDAIITLYDAITARYGVNLYRLTPATCESELLYTNSDAYAITRIAPLDGQLFFSEIENGAAWFAQLLADGARDLTREQFKRDIVSLKLYVMPHGEPARVIGQGIEKAAF